MKLELETSDIAAIANMVTSKLAPLFDEIKRASSQETATTIAESIKARETAKPKSKIVSANELISLTGLSRSTIWRLEKEKKFPGRRSLSGKRVGWVRSEIDFWIESRQQL